METTVRYKYRRVKGGFIVTDEQGKEKTYTNRDDFAADMLNDETFYERIIDCVSGKCERDFEVTIKTKEHKKQ